MYKKKYGRVYTPPKGPRSTIYVCPIRKQFIYSIQFINYINIYSTEIHYLNHKVRLPPKNEITAFESGTRTVGIFYFPGSSEVFEIQRHKPPFCIRRYVQLLIGNGIFFNFYTHLTKKYRKVKLKSA